MAIFEKKNSGSPEFPLALVWGETLAGIFSTMGRMERLAKCFDPRTHLYTQPQLASRTESAALDAAIRALHELVWKDWLSGSLERQQADLLMYASEVFDSIETFVTTWKSERPYCAFPPQSANSEEQAVFVSNLDVLLGRLDNQYCGSAPEPPFFAARLTPHSACASKSSGSLYGPRSVA